MFLAQFARRTSLGGTTVYATHYMAELDGFLRHSGLRLKADGTCQFLFENHRFVIEATAVRGDRGDDDDEGGGGPSAETNGNRAEGGGGGDFLLYADLGSLQELRSYHPDQNLLRLLAYWNQIQTKNRGGGAGDAGLLRIDSSKADGPHVSFIYYGHVDEIQCPKDFQDMLDRFVDDALEFSFKLNPTLGPSSKDRPLDRDRDRDRDRGTAASGQSTVSSAKSWKSNSTNTSDDQRCDSPPSMATTHPSSAASAASLGSKFNDAGIPPSVFKSSFVDRDTANQHDVHPNNSSMHGKYNSPPAPPSSGNSSTSNNNNNTNGNEPSSSGKKGKSVFKKVIKSLRSKNADIAAVAFIDPDNSACPFVASKTAAEGNTAGNHQSGKKIPIPAPTINLHRKGNSFHHSKDNDNGNGNDGHATSLHASFNARKGSSFHVEDGRSSHAHNHRKGSSFHNGDDRERERERDRGRDRQPPQHHSSSMAQRSASRSRRKGSSFHVAEDPSHRSKRGSSSFHGEDHLPSGIHAANAQGKSKSFHHGGEESSTASSGHLPPPLSSSSSRKAISFHNHRRSHHHHHHHHNPGGSANAIRASSRRSTQEMESDYDDSMSSESFLNDAGNAGNLNRSIDVFNSSEHSNGHHPNGGGVGAGGGPGILGGGGSSSRLNYSEPLLHTSSQRYNPSLPKHSSKSSRATSSSKSKRGTGGNARRKTLNDMEHPQSGRKDKVSSGGGGRKDRKWMMEHATAYEEEEDSDCSSWEEEEIEERHHGHHDRSWTMTHA
mmetsp:Transcript_11457/g.23495  ORF Transcript_11457/g.23495 Transcript_11457/m.23495 type:complete len:774 (-) Transcript_11457:376-2697(-)